MRDLKRFAIQSSYNAQYKAVVSVFTEIKKSNCCMGMEKSDAGADTKT